MTRKEQIENAAEQRFQDFLQIDPDHTALGYVKEDFTDGAEWADANPEGINFCPECGYEEIRHLDKIHRQCSRCFQEFFIDLKYKTAISFNLDKGYKAEQKLAIAVETMRIMHQHVNASISDDGPCPVWAEKFEQEYLDALAKIGAVK